MAYVAELPIQEVSHKLWRYLTAEVCGEVREKRNVPRTALSNGVMSDTFSYFTFSIVKENSWKIIK